MILVDPVTHATSDFSQTVALILADVLHHVQDEDDQGKIVAALWTPCSWAASWSIRT